MHTLAGQNEGINDVQFSHDGKQVLSACQDGSLFIRDARSGKDVHRLKDSTGHDNAVICISQCAAYLASGAEDGAVHLINNVNGKILHKLSAHEESVEAMAFGHASIPYLVTASVDCNVKVWDPKNSCQLRHTFPHPDAVTKFQWHPTLPIIATSCNDGVVRVFNVKTGKHIHDFPGHTNIILDICFSKDGKYIITSSDDKTVKVFDFSQVPV
jgi:WD40 repeat protein